MLVHKVFLDKLDLQQPKNYLEEEQLLIRALKIILLPILYLLLILFK